MTPVGKRIGSRPHRMRSLNARAFAKLIGAMVGEDVTYREMAEVSGLHIRTVRRYVNSLHDEGLVHISGWEKDSYGRDCERLFTFGAGKDRTKTKQTKEERLAKVLARRARERDARLLGVANGRLHAPPTNARSDNPKGSDEFFR